jgi:hypothetical protein
VYARNEHGGIVHANDHADNQHKVPTNPRLWSMIVIQAKVKFRTYPSPGASHWVHDQYIKHGGQFAVVSEETRKKKLLLKKIAKKRQEHMAKSERTKEIEGKKGEHDKDDKKK